MLRALTLFVLIFVAPGTSDLVGELVATASGVDCCDDGSCEDRPGQGCACHCGHCAHPSGVLSAVLSLPRPASPEPRIAVAYVQDGRPSGVRASLFRPPAA